MIKRFWHVIFFIAICGSLAGQGDIDPQDRIFWRNEKSVGPALNADGWSLIYRDLRQFKPGQRWFLKEVSKVSSTPRRSSYPIIISRVPDHSCSEN